MKYELLDESGCPIYVIDIEKIGEYDNLKPMLISKYGK